MTNCLTLIFSIGVIFGSLLAGVTNPKYSLIGASAGCTALVLTHVADVIINGDIMDHEVIVIRLAILTPMLILCLFDAVSASTEISDFTSYFAHLGGSFTGLFFGVGCMKNFQKESWKRTMYWCFLGVFVLGFLVVLVMNLVKSF